MDSGSLVVVIVVLAFAAALVWQWFATQNALGTTRVESRYPPAEAMRVVQGAFTGARGVLWTGDDGPGAINMRRRGKDGGITMSIVVVPLPAGGSAVDMWASRYNRYFGLLANFAGSVNSRKKDIARLLTT